MFPPKVRQDEEEEGVEIPEGREDYWTWKDDDIVWVDEDDLEQIIEEEEEE